MDRRYFLSFLFLLTLLIADCSFHKKIEYNIPEDIKGKQRDELLATLEKGRKLYEVNCSKCHGIFTKGKDGIPNFTDQQFDSYAAYAIKRDRRNHAVAAGMSPEQLHEVIMFLKDRKRKGTTTVQVLPQKTMADTVRK